MFLIPKNLVTLSTYLGLPEIGAFGIGYYRQTRLHRKESHLNLFFGNLQEYILQFSKYIYLLLSIIPYLMFEVLIGMFDCK